MLKVVELNVEIDRFDYFVSKRKKDEISSWVNKNISDVANCSGGSYAGYFLEDVCWEI